jgi:hypothetical protein
MAVKTNDQNMANKYISVHKQVKKGEHGALKASLVVILKL